MDGATVARALMLAGLACAAGCFHATPYSTTATVAKWRSIHDSQSKSSSEAVRATGRALTVDDAYALALERSPDVAALEARADAAHADVKTAGQLDNPQLRLTGFNVDDVIANQTTMNIGLRVPIPRPGTVRARVEGAKHSALGEASWTEDAKRQLRARIETLYARLAKHTADLEQAERATSLRALRRDEIAARAEQAVATRLDVAMAQVLQAEAMQDQAKIRDEIAAVENELRRMVGAVDLVTFAIDSTALQVVDAELDRAVLTERAMASRPELRAAHARIVEAQSEAYVARSEAWPWFDWAQLQYRAAPGSPPSAFGFGVALTLPILSWNKGAIRASRATVRRREQEERARIFAVAAEVEEALDRVERTGRRVEEIERDLLPQIEAATREVKAAMASGALDPMIASEVDTREVDAQRLHLAAKLEHREAIIDLEAAVGAPITSSKAVQP